MTHLSPLGLGKINWRSNWTYKLHSTNLTSTLKEIASSANCVILLYLGVVRNDNRVIALDDSQLTSD